MKEERILILPKGEYDSNKQYKALDMVIYENKAYLCVADSIGNVPTNQTYFHEFISFPAIQQLESRVPFGLGIVDGSYGYYDTDGNFHSFSSGGSSPLYLIRTSDTTGEGASISVIDLNTMNDDVVFFLNVNDHFFSDHFYIDYNVYNRYAYTLHVNDPCECWYKEYQNANQEYSQLSSGDAKVLFAYSNSWGQCVIKF